MPRSKSMLIQTFEQKQQLVIARAGVRLAEHKLKQFETQQKTLDAARAEAQKELQAALQTESKLTGTPVKAGAVESSAPKRKGRPKGSKNKPKETPKEPAASEPAESDTSKPQAAPTNDTAKAAVQKLLEEFKIPSPMGEAAEATTS